MNHVTLRKSALVAGLLGAAALVALGGPLALAAPTAPPSDGQGYLESTARCAKPAAAVLFGSTDTSRVAICQTSGGDYIYRGVRVSDGAKLVAEATKTATDTFVVKHDAVTYTVTPQSLSVSAGGTGVRTETWTDYHGPQAPATTTVTVPPTTSGTTSAPATTAPTTSQPPSTSQATTTSAVPLPPPMPAEVGGGKTSIS